MKDECINHKFFIFNEFENDDLIQLMIVQNSF
jgi:hypothetical protein